MLSGNMQFLNVSQNLKCMKFELDCNISEKKKRNEIISTQSKSRSK